jgi:hypothetical protein
MFTLIDENNLLIKRLFNNYTNNNYYIIVNKSIEELNELNKIYRNNYIFISINFNNFGFTIFTDLGDLYIYYALNDKKYKFIPIIDIKNNIIETNYNNFDVNTYVIFNNKKYKIKSVSKTRIELYDFEYNDIFINDKIYYCDQEFELKHNPLNSYNLSFSNEINNNINYLIRYLGTSYIINEIVKIESKIGTPIEQVFKLNYNLNFKNYKNILVVGENNYLIDLLDNLNYNYKIALTYNKNIKDIDIIINNITDINVIKEIDTDCFNNNIALININLMNSFGVIHPIIPNKTKTFINSYYDYYSEYFERPTYPPCVIKNFPNTFEHCILWAIDVFEYINFKIINFEEIVKYSYDLFSYLFITQINELLNNFSEWKNGKIQPNTILYDETWIESTIELMCDKFDYEEYYKIIKSYKGNKLFSPKLNNEKSKITNKNIKWIYSTAIKRANNYNIFIDSFDETYNYIFKNYKINTNLNRIASCYSLIEVLKYENDYDTYNIIKLNTSNNYLEREETKSENWDKIYWTENTTLSEFKRHFENKFETNITMISCNTTLLYSIFSNNTNINLTFQQIFNNNLSNVEIIMLSDDDNIDIPPIILNINI